MYVEDVTTPEQLVLERENHKKLMAYALMFYNKQRKKDADLLAVIMEFSRITGMEIINLPDGGITIGLLINPQR